MTSFSVLMSLYAKERPENLKLSLNSVFNQTLVPNEVVLVEDGPLTQELYAVLDSYPTLKRIRLATNGGLGRALNEGLTHCSHQLVARMDTDDIATPDRFEKQIAVFERYSDADVVSCWVDEFEGDPSNIIATRKVPEYPYELYKYGKTRCPINHPACVFKKDVVLFAGGYQHFPLFEDYSLWVRLLLNGAKFYNIQESLLLFRASPDMYRRRGGFKHGWTEVKFQNYIRKIGYINWPTMLMNVFIRFTTRIMPNSLREFVYRDLLR